MLSAGLIHLMNISSNIDTDIDLLVNEIEKNQSVLMRTISISNSAFFRAQSPITSCKDAVVRIGKQMIGGIITSIAINGRFNGHKLEHFDKQKHCLDSVLVAFILTEIARRNPDLVDSEKQFLYTAGLLHNLGLMTLIHTFPSETNTLLKSIQPQDDSFDERVVETFSFNQYQVLAWLLRTWKMPELFIVVLGHINDKSYDGKHNHLLELVLEAIAIARCITSTTIQEPCPNKALKTKHQLVIAKAKKNIVQLNDLATMISN